MQFKRLLIARRNLHVSSFFIYIASSPIRKLRRFFIFRAIQRADTPRERFTIIYDKNAWGSKESVSGSGSTLEKTESIRKLLPVLINDFSIKSILDVPCGDFNWMQKVNLYGLRYVGGDIVEALILRLQRDFNADNITFHLLDITKDPFPKSDLVLNRDCLFHLSYQDILAVLDNFLFSGSSYFLTTSHDNDSLFLNANIQSGDFRLIDLFASPFNFPRSFFFEIPEPGEGSLPPRKLYLWNREQIRVAHSNLENYLGGL